MLTCQPYGAPLASRQHLMATLVANLSTFLPGTPQNLIN